VKVILPSRKSTIKHIKLHLLLCLPCDLLVFQIKFVSAPIHSACSTNLIYHSFTSLIIFYEDYMVLNSTLCSFFHTSVDTIFEVPNCIKTLLAAWKTKYLNRQIKEAYKTSPLSKIYLFVNALRNRLIR